MSLGTPITSPFTTSLAVPFSGGPYAYDVALGGLPFLMAVGPDTPMTVETAPYRKEQFDSAKDVGEQSLAYWWLKSQSSFHGGTGQHYLDTALNDDPDQPIRFADSLGVNVWTAGAVTLLPTMPVHAADVGAVQRLLGAVDGAIPVLFRSSNAALTRHTSGASAAVASGAVGNITSLATDGSSYFAATDTQVIRGTLAGGPGTAIYATSGATVLGWAKQRLMAGIGNKLYELNSNAAAATVLPAAKYTHPNANWVWTSIVEGPAGIYASGYAGSTSAILRLVLTAAGEVPVLTGGVTVAEMPPGENVESLFCYLGSTLAIGTSKGLRIAVVEGNGDLSYGPRVFDTALPVRAIVGEDKFLYAGVGNGLAGLSGLYRINLSRQSADGRFAYATDLQAKMGGAVSGLALLGGLLAVTVDGSGLYLEGTALEAVGTLTTSKIRYGTVEPKLLKFVRLRAAPLQGSVSAAYVDPGGAVVQLATYDVQGQTELEEVAFASPPLEYASLILTLRRSAVTATLGPQLRSYQLKALPAQKRQRLIQLPLMCFNEEKDRSGQRLGRVGTALSRLQALQALEAEGDTVNLQQFSAESPTLVELVVIDQLRFVQRDEPTGQGGWGGIILATLRTVT